MVEKMTPEDHRAAVLVTVERIEGKMDRMGDQIKVTEKGVAVLLDVVTGSKPGAKNSHVVRIIALESQVGRLEETVSTIKVMEDKLDDVLRMQADHPPLLYLLRFQTRKTIFWIVLIFVILSAFYVSGIRIPILEFLGLPIF